MLSGEKMRDREVAKPKVTVSLPRPVPQRVVHEGTWVRLEPLDADRHARDLYRLGHDGSEKAERSWDYLPYGPFATEAEHKAWIATLAAGTDPLFFAIVDRASGEAMGQGSLMSIVPSDGVIEIGHLWFSPKLQRTPAATEALFLMLRHALDDLGYRRMEWKCDACNLPSRKAALRLGYRFEGIFYNHRVVKGHNRDTAWYSILDEEWPALRNAFAAWLSPANFDGAGNQRSCLSELTRD